MQEVALTMVDVGKQSEEGPSPDLLLMWTSHMEVLKQVMEALRHKELFADATLICGEKQFAVHQFVLSTCSLYLENLFRSIPCEHPVLMLPDTPPKAMEKLLDFMYLGQADLTQDELDQLLDLAEELNIIGLIQTNSDAENQNWSLSLDKDDRMNKVDDSKYRGAATFDGLSKTTNQKISQDPSKGAMKNYTKTKELKKVKGKTNPHNNKVCEENLKQPTTLQDHTKDDQVINSLLSCPECPFKTLSAATMTQHKYKHSLGRPYMCPHCHVRHSVEELHIAHQKRNHPRMEVVVNKSINIGLGRSEGGKSTSLGTSECVSPSSFSSNVQQTHKNNQVVSSEPPPISACNEISDSDNAEVIPENQQSTVKTDVSLQFLGQSKSKPSTLSSLDCHILAALLQSPTKTQKTSKRRRISISHEDENSKHPSLEQLSTPPIVNTSETSSKSTHQKSFIGNKRSLRPRKR